MDREQGRTQARLAVAAEMAHRRWTNTELAKRSGVDINTIGDFLAGSRWPKSPTQGRLESALDWPAGTISAIAAGMPTPPVGGTGEDQEVEEDTLRFRRPDGISDQEWERVKERTRGIIEWELDRAARER